MTSIAPPASEIVPLPDRGRRFLGTGRVRLGDVDQGGRLRLDAAARHLQDIANDDALDADLPNAFGWVVRRTLIRVERMPVLGEELRATTFCSGTGRSWAERRTSIVGDDGGALEAVSLWVQVDPTTGRPAALGDAFAEIYGTAAAGRRVSARLLLPPAAEIGDAPSADPMVRRSAWPVRRVDIDVLGHVNNAVAWAILHELLGDAAAEAGAAEVEYLAGIEPDDSPLELRSLQTLDTERGVHETTAWLLAEGTVRIAARWRRA